MYELSARDDDTPATDDEPPRDDEPGDADDDDDTIDETPLLDPPPDEELDEELLPAAVVHPRHAHAPNHTHLCMKPPP